MPFVPHTSSQVQDMLRRLGARSVVDLYDEIPETLLRNEPPGIPSGLDEAGIGRIARQRAGCNDPLLCFAGGGAYEHHIPAAIWDIASRGEFYSNYTPYQPEAAQGTLQLTYEYQTMIAGLTGMDVANASLYDGATAFAEACLMAVRCNKKSDARRIAVARSLHPAWRAVARTLLNGQGIELVEAPLDDSGRADFNHVYEKVGGGFDAIAVAAPNYLGGMPDLKAWRALADREGSLLVVVINPVSLGLLRPPGEFGADIVCGEGQPLGIPMSGGGPYLGLLACKAQYIRQMPGRLAGRTVDAAGDTAYVLTLQAREQHIRRSRATSNICTNQGLMVVAATLYMALLGGEGMRRVASACHARTAQLVDALTAIGGVRRAFDAPFFHEDVLCLDRPVAPVLAALAEQGILGGIDISSEYPELGNALLVCATEMRTEDDILRYARALREIVAPGQRASRNRRATSARYTKHETDDSGQAA